MPNLILLATILTQWTWLIHLLLQATNFAFDCLGFDPQLPHIEVNNLDLGKVIGQDCTLAFSGPKLTSLVLHKDTVVHYFLTLYRKCCSSVILSTFSEAYLQSGRK
jgi:hypothetical protein